MMITHDIEIGIGIYDDYFEGNDPNPPLANISR
jgi:hypothetical protein